MAAESQELGRCVLRWSFGCAHSPVRGDPPLGGCQRSVGRSLARCWDRQHEMLSFGFSCLPSSLSVPSFRSEKRALLRNPGVSEEPWDSPAAATWQEDFHFPPPRLERTPVPPLLPQLPWLHSLLHGPVHPPSDTQTDGPSRTIRRSRAVWRCSPSVMDVQVVVNQRGEKRE